MERCNECGMRIIDDRCYRCETRDAMHARSFAEIAASVHWQDISDRWATVSPIACMACACGMFGVAVMATELRRDGTPVCRRHRE